MLMRGEIINKCVKKKFKIQSTVRAKSIPNKKAIMNGSKITSATNRINKRITSNIRRKKSAIIAEPPQKVNKTTSALSLIFGAYQVVD